MVVPRVGGRGLKFVISGNTCRKHSSRPPRRGTWIEMQIIVKRRFEKMVVPRVGGRGLKSFIYNLFITFARVVPRVGGRGLKLPVIGLGIGVMLSSPA